MQSIPSIGSSSTTNVAQAQQSLDSKTNSIKTKALEIIRTTFPLTTLFTPELKIDLSVFVKDQVFFNQIAQFLFAYKGSADANSMAKYFEGSELITEIKGMFKQDPTPYLKLFFEACADVVNKKPLQKKIKASIEGRIFTLKNALIAQQSPEIIVNSQKSCNITQTIDSIKDEGAGFIREVLSLHMNFHSLPQKSFRDHLTATAEQLLPFVEKVTKSYLAECKQPCDRPLTFRNPSGYNHHGLLANTVMEACLSALGFKTRLLNRVDLEPKVTLATAHNIVEATDPDGTKYVVDPCYIQFHKDICPNDSALPTAPVLVLKADEVDAYVEKNFMGHWRVYRQDLWNKGASYEKILLQRDHLLAVCPEKYAIDQALAPTNPDAWVKESFKKVWNLPFYNPLLSDAGYQFLFLGSDQDHKTYDSIKAMNIHALNSRLPFAEVEKRLNDLSQNKALIGKNSIEALLLIAQLPTRAKQAAYSSLLDVDPRIEANYGLSVLLNAYFRSLKKVVNPEGQNKTVLYGCSGADVMTPLLATDANNIIFVDLTRVSVDDFRKALQTIKSTDNLSLMQNLESRHKFVTAHARLGGASSVYKGKGEHEMEQLPLKLLYDLLMMGVVMNEVKFSSTASGNGVTVTFPWKYHGQSTSKQRVLTLLQANITRPESYSEELKAQLQKGFDIFYMKGAFVAPLSYPQFLPTIAASLYKNGWFMTSDKTFTMEYVDPMTTLNKTQFSFSQFTHPENTALANLLAPPFDPMVTVPCLEYFPNSRLQRTSGSDHTYWSVLNLRQKGN